MWGYRPAAPPSTPKNRVRCLLLNCFVRYVSENSQRMTRAPTTTCLCLTTSHGRIPARSSSPTWKIWCHTRLDTAPMRHRDVRQGRKYLAPRSLLRHYTTKTRLVHNAALNWSFLGYRRRGQILRFPACAGISRGLRSWPCKPGAAQGRDAEMKVQVGDLFPLATGAADACQGWAVSRDGQVWPGVKAGAPTARSRVPSLGQDLHFLGHQAPPPAEGSHRH